LQKGLAAERKLGWHAGYVAIFLVFAHLAMIAGMTDPTLLGHPQQAHSAQVMPAHGK
jgi:hypothetical protein